MNITIDIETIPAQRPDIMADIRETKQAELDAAIAAVKYKKQETIDEWIANEKPKQIQALRDSFDASVEEAYRKTGLDGSFGNVCVIGFAFDDGPVQLISSLNESSVLSAFNEALDPIPSSEIFKTCVIGHNVVAFDLRFLAQRYIVNGIKPHPVIARAAQAKPWDIDKVFDTSSQWTGSASTRISLDKLCKALSIPTPKDGITGATVWDAIKEGRIEEVAAYCAKDVKATREAYKRMTFQTVAA